jgi:hypothetical protein
MRVEMSSWTGVGPVWRRFIGTIRSDWSTEDWLW